LWGLFVMAPLLQQFFAWALLLSWTSKEHL
jgi:hypothetical protein